MTEVAQFAALVLVALGGPAVVLTREPVRQAIVVSLFGLSLALLFFVFQAPDVALSQIVVGSVALPAMILLAVSKIRSRDREEEE
ncbi:MAG: Na(+)/H(+) antiporter subunit B [Thermoleophilaceae bacterium]